MRVALVGGSLLALLIIGGCGGSDDGDSTADPASACKALVKELCSKFYGCYSDDELAAASTAVGNNETDCRTKLEGEDCGAEQLKCDSGKKYNSDKASECLSQEKSLSCSEFKNSATATPAACDQVCQ